MTYPHIDIGYPDMDGPNTNFKDIRYYFTSSLDETDMNTIKNDFTCKQMCEICSDPDTCT